MSDADAGVTDLDPAQYSTADGSDRPLPPEAVPGPRGLPLLGNTHSFVRDQLGFLASMPDHGAVASYRAFGRRFVVVSDPELVEAVLVSRADEFWKGEFETEFGELLAPEGVVFTQGDRWRRQRRFLQGVFTPDRIDAYATDMLDETVRLVEGWADGGTVDVRDAFSRLTLRVLTRSLFALELDGPRADVVSRWVAATGDYVDRDLLGPRSLLPDWVPGGAEADFERAQADLTDLVETLAAERRAADADGDDLLTLLSTGEYPDGSRPSPAEIRDQLLTFLVAGHETTSTALTYACWLLADDAAVRARLDRELDRVLGGRDPTVADLPDLAVTEAIVREAMRCYPPFPFLDREPHEPTALGGYRVEPGTTIQLNAYGIHRDERWWDDPDAFRPERWLASDGRSADGNPTLEADPDRPEYAYFPFGGGPRHCLGMRFAMTELKLALATMARRVRFDRLTESIDPRLRVSLDPGPVEVRVLDR